MKGFFCLLTISVFVFCCFTMVEAQTVSYKTADDTEYTLADIGDLGVGSLATATHISLSGTWNGNDFLKFKNAIRLSGVNSTVGSDTLTVVDMSNVVLTGSNFSSASYNGDGLAYLFANCTSLTEVVLPATPYDGTGQISLAYAFYKCTSLVSVVNLELQSKLSSLSNVFFGCTQLKSSLDLSKSTNISSLLNAFYNCSSLTTIKLPTAINTNAVSLSYAFYGCNNLQSPMD